MKIIYRTSLFVSVLLAAISAVSCTGRDEVIPVSDGINITFTTADAAEVQVKGSTAPGDDAFNENLLNSVYYFFYPQGKTAVAPSVSGYKTGISETETYQVKIPVSANTIINDLFASSNECQLFAVANPPTSLVSALEGKPTLAQLRAMTVASSLTNVPQSNFTLVYDGTVAAASLSQKVSINAVIEMKHLAAKFTIGAIVIPSITQGADTYTPDGLSVSFCNGINKTTLGGWSKSAVDKDDYFSTEYKTMTASGTETVGSDTYKKYTLSSPIYSYPMEWEFNSDVEPYLMYELRWKITNGGSTQYKSLYYKLTLGRRTVMPNEWYDISGKLTVLGSLYPEEPTEIYYYMDYLVNGWKGALSDDGVNTPATIKDTRYLAVNQTEWVLNNKNEVTIPFSSSHQCSYANLTATKKDFSSGTPANQNVSGVTIDLTIPNQVTVHHDLNNTLGAGMDISPIEISFTLWHDDNHDFSQVIHITQYPAIYVTTELNSSGTTDTETYKGYTYVNGRQDGGTWMTVLGANSGTTGSNTSRYFTVITVSQFDPSTGYIIGDPRDTEINNLGSTGDLPWTGTGNYAPFQAPAKYSGDGQTGNRTVKYYHPTIDDGSRDNFVAPSFRVSTAHTRSGRNDTYADIKKRCASYQEDGYPAGRWRIPTLAECKLCQVLSGNGMVPNIFIQGTNAYGQSSYYFYAGGYFTINSSGVGNYRIGDTSHDAAARCVYDEWYWSQVDAKMGWNNSNKTTFTWGDVPDDFVIPAL